MMTDNSPILLGRGAATVSVPERVTSALLSLHIVLRVERRDPDMDQAIEICDRLARALLGIGMKFDHLPLQLGLPEWLRNRCLEAETGYFARLIDALDALDVPEVWAEDLVLGLEGALRNARSCPEISAESLTDVGALAAYSAEGEEGAPDDLTSAASRARLARVDIPVVLTTGNGECGALLAADLEFEPIGGFRTEWPAHSKKGCVKRCYSESIRTGFNAAVELLKKMDHSVDQYPVLKMRNVEAPVSLEGRSVALPVAIATLRSFLSLPPPLCVVSGAIDEHGRILPIDKDRPSHARAKLRAVLDEGSLPRLVVVTRKDHALSGLDAIVAPNASLYQVASKIWGERFSDLRKEAENDRLKAIGIASGWRGTDFPKPDDLFVKTAKATELERLILNADGPKVFSIGGPARSGKSWIANDVEQRLRRRDWQTYVFDCDGSTVSTKDLTESLTGIIEDLMQPAEHRLIVLDGLRYTRQWEKLLLNIGDLAIRLKAYVLVVRQTDSSSEGDEPSGAEVSSIVSSEDHHMFIRELAEQYPDVLAKRGLTAEEFRNQYAGTGTFDLEAPQRGLPHDLFWICQTAQYGRDPIGYHRFLMEPVADTEKALLERLAYATLYGIGCENDLVAGLGPETRRRFRVVGDANSVAWINQPLNARMALWDPDKPDESLGYLEQQRGASSILPILKHVILPPKDHPLSQKPDLRAERLGFIIRHLLRKWRNTVHLIFLGDGHDMPPFLRSESDEIKALLDENFAGTPWGTARLILDMDCSLPLPKRLVLLHNMTIQMTREARAKHPRFTCNQLAVCYSAVFEYRWIFHKVPEGQEDTAAETISKQREISDTWHKFRKESKRSGLVRRICEEEPEPRGRLKLFDSMVKLDDTDIQLEACEIIHTMKTGMGKMGGKKYRYLLDLRRSITDFHPVLATLEERQCVSDSRTKVTDNKLMQKDIDQICKNEVDLARSGKTGFTCLVDFTDLVCLMLSVGGVDPKEDAEFFTKMFDSLANTETLEMIINSIGAIHATEKPAAIFLIKNSKLFYGSHLLHAGRRASLTDFSKLLFSLNKWDPEMLKSYLFHRMDPQRVEPNRALADALAERVKEEGDLRNFQKILRAGGKCDLSVLSKPGEGFAAAFLAKVSRRWLVDRIRGETRTEILCNLVDGLEHLDRWPDDLREAMVEQLSEAMANRTFSKWNARLYRKLLDNEATKPVFSEPLLDPGRFKVADLVGGMANAQDAEAYEEYHIIGRMRRDIGAKFVSDNPPNQFGLFLEERLSDQKMERFALRIIRTVTETYRQFNPNMANAYINGVDWDALRAALEHNTVSSLGHLRYLAELSRDKVAELIRSDEGQEILDRKLRDAVGKPEFFVDILFNCEKSVPGEGRRLLFRMKTEHLRFFETKLNERGEKNPRAYAASVNKLADVWPEIVNRTTTFFERWRPKLNRMTSSETLFQVLRLLERADSSALLQAADKVDVDRVAHWLKTRGGADDYIACNAHKLADLLDRAEQADKGRVIAEAMAEVEARKARLGAYHFLGQG